MRRSASTQPDGDRPAAADVGHGDPPVGDSARWQTEALLHARSYTPAEALERGMIDEVVPPDAVPERARTAAAASTAPTATTYAASKRRPRAEAVDWAKQHLEEEMLSFKMPGACPRLGVTPSPR